MRWIKVGIVICVLIATMALMVGCGRQLTEADFELKITVNSHDLYKGQNIEVEVIFKNLSGRRLVTSHGNPMIVVRLAEQLIIKHPDGSDELIYSGVRQDVLIRSVLTRDQEKGILLSMGSNLPVGEFAIVADASFTVRGNDIQILSAPILLTVQENKGGQIWRNSLPDID